MTDHNEWKLELKKIGSAEYRLTAIKNSADNVHLCYHYHGLEDAVACEQAQALYRRLVKIDALAGYMESSKPLYPAELTKLLVSVGTLSPEEGSLVRSALYELFDTIIPALLAEGREIAFPGLGSFWMKDGELVFSKKGDDDDELV